MNSGDISNKKYISTKEASALTGYSKDYIGQLARSEKIESKRIGRTWYIGEESLRSYENSITKPEVVLEEPVKKPEIKKNIFSEVSLRS